MKLSRADVVLIELRNKIKFFISKSSSMYLKEVLRRSKPTRTIRKVKV